MSAGGRLWIVSRYVPLDTSPADGKTLVVHLSGYKTVETIPPH